MQSTEQGESTVCSRFCNDGSHVTLGWCHFTSLDLKPSQVKGQNQTRPCLGPFKKRGSARIFTGLISSVVLSPYPQSTELTCMTFGTPGWLSRTHLRKDFPTAAFAFGQLGNTNKYQEVFVQYFKVYKITF